MSRNIQSSSNRKLVGASTKSDRVDVKDLWKAAIIEYKEILGPDARNVNVKFRNVDDMINFGNDQVSTYSKWRHPDSKLDKIRSRFRDNIELIETGTQKLIEAATPAFPPASIISTALTFVLAGCKSVSADFDMVAAFFDEMNSFLLRVKIIEGKLPREKEYHMCLTEVFTSLLALCATATKIISDGRFKKWVANVFLGEDGDLALARGRLSTSFERLESITLLKVLANTEDARVMQAKLNENSELHTNLLREQENMLQSIAHNQIVAQDDLNIIKQILLEQKARQQTPIAIDPKLKQGAKGIKTIIPDDLDNRAELAMVQQTRLAETCDWLFEHPNWQVWVKTGEHSIASPLLVIYGAPGIGKSYLAVAAHDHFQTMIAQEARQSVYVASFFCRRDMATLNSFQDIVGSVILQISEHAPIYEDINAVLTRDGHIAENEYLNRLLAPLFNKDSASFLYIIIDAIDELEADHDRNLLKEMIDLVETRKLNIKVLVTSRTLLDTSTDQKHGLFSSSTEISVDKQNILHDLEKIIADRLDSTDSAYKGIHRLKVPVKKQIIRRLKEKADGLQYTELALRHLSSIGREGAVMRQLESFLPENAAGFLKNDMNQCWQKIPDDRVDAFRLLLAYLTFGFELLSLDTANVLVQSYSNDKEFLIEEDLDGIYGRVFQAISTTGANIDEAEESVEEVISFDDGDFKLVLRDRAMHDFLSTHEPATSEQKSCFSRSAAHRAIFITCFDLIAERSLSSGTQIATTLNVSKQSLYRYAIRYCLRHWQLIDCTKHSRAENIAVLERFAVLLREGTYLATQIEAMGFEYSIDLLVATHQYDDQESWKNRFSKCWSTWSHWVVQNLSSTTESQPAGISLEAYKYWSSRGDEILLPLAKAHIHNWLRTTEYSQGKRSYYFARKAVLMTTMHSKLYFDLPPEKSDDTRRFDEDGDARRKCIEEVYALRSMSETEVDSQTHWATAALFRDIGFLWIPEFRKEAEEAKRKSKNFVQQFRSNNLIARDECQPYRSAGYEEGRERLKSFLDRRDGIPAPDVAEALVLSIGFLTVDKEFDGDREAQLGMLLIELRDMEGKYFLPSSMLNRAFEFFCDHNGLRSLGMVTKLKATQQLTLCSSPEFWKYGVFLAHDRLLRDALLTGNINTLIKFYDEMITILDKQNSGAVLKKYLAHLYWTVNQDVTATKAKLIEALIVPQSTKEFELFRLDAGFVAIETINLMSDVIYHEFRRTSDPKAKSALLGEAQALLRQPFPESLQINRTSTIPHLLVNAAMTRKMGSSGEWQAALQQAFDISWANLHDLVGWNDPINLRYLSRVIAQVPGLERDAQILNSAQFYYIGHESVLSEFIKSTFVESLWTYHESYDMHFKGWISVRDRLWVYARDGRIRWDTARNEWEFIRELAEGENPDLVFGVVDFDKPIKITGEEKVEDEEDDSFMEMMDEEDDGWRSHFDRRVIFENDYDEKRAQNPEVLDPIEEELFEDFESMNPGGWSLVLPSTIEAHQLSAPQCAGCGKTWLSHLGWRDPMFTCLLCTNSVLCRYCYQDRMAWNRTGQSNRKLHFCCDGGQYLRSPVAKWQGIRYRQIFIEGEKPLEWDVFMEGVKVRWDKAWEEFWMN